MEMELDVYQQFYLWRYRRKLSETGAALALGCSRSTIRRIESGDVWPGKYLPVAALPQTWSVAEEFHLLRHGARLSQRAAAEVLGVCVNVVQGIEHGRISLSYHELRSIKQSFIYHRTGELRQKV